MGWEVYLDFTDGDPDLPFVFGRMYNGKTRPPYELPKHKTRMSIQTATTPGGGSVNEIRMEDKAGARESTIRVDTARLDQVLTAGGFLGKVTKVDDNYAEVELAPNVRVKALKSTIADIVPPTGSKPAND